MKIILFVLLSSFSFYTAQAEEIEYIYLNNGMVLDAKYDYIDIPLNEIKAIEISNDQGSSKSTYLILNSKNAENDNFSKFSTRMGGEGGGGGGGGG